MNERMNEERLNDYVDGLLSEDEAREVEDYLAGSAEAHQTVESLRLLKARTAELPDSIEPSRDLWPGIAEKMAPAPLASLEGTNERAGEPEATRGFAGQAADIRKSFLGSLWPRLDAFQWATLAAAAMLLVVSSSAITAWFVQAPGAGLPGDVSQAAGATPIANAALDSLHPIEAEYALQIEDLLWALYENRETLDPDTVTTIETNLRVINRAIRQAREALEEDPEHPGLARMLTHGYRNKLQVLQRVSRLIERS